MKSEEVYTLAEIKEQEEGLTEEQRIQQVVSHEAYTLLTEHLAELFHEAQ